MVQKRNFAFRFKEYNIDVTTPTKVEKCKNSTGMTFMKRFFLFCTFFLCVYSPIFNSLEFYTIEQSENDQFQSDSSRYLLQIRVFWLHTLFFLINVSHLVEINNCNGLLAMVPTLLYPTDF